MESQKLIAQLSEINKDNNNVGEDVVEQILSTLPSKSLMRFKSVSKNWYALITSPRFVAKHLSHSMHKKLSTTSVLLKRLVQKTDETDEKVFSLFNFRNDNDEHSLVSSCEDVKVPLALSLETRGDSLDVIGHCDGIICLATANSCRVILWNPAIQEFKLLPNVPHLPDSLKGYQRQMKRDYSTLGFGYDPRSKTYKVVNVYSLDVYVTGDEGEEVEICSCSMAAVCTLGTDSWRESESCSFETQTTLLQPGNFQLYFQGLCYWFGVEQHKEISIFDEHYIRNVIILFDMGNEVFDSMPLPFGLYDWGNVCFCERLLVWNESFAFCGTYNTGGYYCSSLGIWVMDEFGDQWTKHFTIEITERPLAFLKSDEILMVYKNNGCLFSYNLGTKTQKHLPIQPSIPSYESDAVSYVDSIVPLLGGKKLKTEDTSTSADIFLFKCSPVSHSIADKKWYSYSVWAFPPNNVSLRIRNVMDSIRAEFGGPEIEPHIPVVGSIRMSHDEVLSKFISLQSEIVYSYRAKVDQVVSRNFYYQCVCLLIDSSAEISPQLEYATRSCSIHFGMGINEHRPRLSLLCGNLTEEERKLARERVSIMDESITSLSFPITRLGLYKINYRDTTLKSWEKILEYDLVFN